MSPDTLLDLADALTLVYIGAVVIGCLVIVLCCRAMRSS